MLSCGEKVIVINDKFLTVTKYQTGMVVGQDLYRSRYDYDTFVLWDEMLSGYYRSTWISEKCLQKI